MSFEEEFFRIIDTRKTIRKFDSQKPTTEQIKRLIESARLAPSAVNAQNWEFIAVYNEDVKQKMALAVLKKYEEILSKIEDEQLKEQISRYKGHSTFFEHAPVVMAIVQTKAPSFLDSVLETAGYDSETIKNMRPDSQLLSMGGAIENICLGAHALGLGTCWMVAPIIAAEKFKEILNIKKEDKIVSLIAIGKPATDISDKRSPKKSLEEISRIIM